MINYKILSLLCIRLKLMGGLRLKKPLMHSKQYTKSYKFLIISAESLEFKNGVTALADLLKIPPNPDPFIRLEACAKLLETRLNQKDEFSSEKCIEINLKDHDFGFSDKTMDPVMKEAAKILRLLHLTNLRKLQSEINNTIELVQNVTANPKTDTKSGKVGR